MLVKFIVLALVSIACAMPVDQAVENAEIPDMSAEEMHALFDREKPVFMDSSVAVGNSSDNKTVIVGPDCVDVPVLGNTCVSIYDIVANLTLGVEIQVRGMTIDRNIVHANQTCIDDASLIKLVELIPVLVPFRPIINKLIAVLGFIPGSVLSVCVDITDFNLDTDHHEISGCADLASTLMCWKGKCIYKGDKDLGCFKKPY